MQILKIKGFAHFAEKNEISDERLLAAIKEVEEGLFEADLGGWLIKKRIARDGAGKSGGYRSIIVFKKGKLAFFLYGFPKNARDNIKENELLDFKRLARIYLKLTEAEITKAIDAGKFIEVSTNG